MFGGVRWCSVSDHFFEKKLQNRLTPTSQRGKRFFPNCPFFPFFHLFNLLSGIFRSVFPFISLLSYYPATSLPVPVYPVFVPVFPLRFFIYPVSFFIFPTQFFVHFIMDDPPQYSAQSSTTLLTFVHNKVDGFSHGGYKKWCRRNKFSLTVLLFYYLQSD